MKKLFFVFLIVALLPASRAFSQNSFQMLYGIGMMTIEWSVTQTSDHGYMIAGFQNAGIPIRIELVKTDSTGAVVWAKKYGKELIPIPSTEDPTAVSMPMCVRQTTDGGYIVCGSMNSKAYLLKITSTGAISWARTYGNSNGTGVMVKQTADGGYIFTGSRADATKNDSTNIYLVKTSSAGALTWDRTYRFSTVDDDGGNAVEVVSDGYVVAGYTTQINGTDTTSDIVLLKTDLSGTLQWAKTWGANADFEDAYDVKSIAGGGFVLTGSTDNSVSGLDGSDLYIMTTDASGNQLSSSAYSVAETDIAWRVVPTNPGYAVMGTTFSLFGVGFLDMFLMKVNGSGAVISGQVYNQSMAHNLFTDGQQTADGGFVLGGWGNNITSMDMMVIKTGNSGVSGCLENSVTPVQRVYAPATETATPTVINTTTSTSVTAFVSNQTVDTTILCINSALVVYAGNDQTICQYNPITLGGSPTAMGGTSPYTYSWSPFTYLSSASVANPVMTPTASGTFTYTVTVNDNAGGTASDAVVITVNPAPNAALTLTNSICIGAGSFALTGGTPAGGTYSGAGVSGTTFNPTTAGLGNHTITYIVCNGSCCDTATADILVYDNPDATINPSGPYCDNALPDTLTAADAGGTWSGAGITNASAGVFDPATAGPGSHVITYTFPAPCPAEDTITLIVLAGANATITDPGSLCVFDDAVALSAADTGGVWSGVGVSNPSTGMYDPSTAGLGNHQVIYAISGQCGDADTIMIAVVSSIDATIDSVADICSDVLPFNLAAANPGGIWAGTGITSTSLGTFDPALAQAGVHQIIYTISGSCGNSDTIAINVLNCEVNPVVYIPNVFSPNGDGINDLLYVRGQGFKELTFYVYDRWGEKVFETTDENTAWDGTYKGKPLDNGVYVYYVKVIFLNDEEFENKGNISIIR